MNFNSRNAVLHYDIDSAGLFEIHGAVLFRGLGLGIGAHVWKVVTSSEWHGEKNIIAFGPLSKAFKSSCYMDIDPDSHLYVTMDRIVFQIHSVDITFMYLYTPSKNCR